MQGIRWSWFAGAIAAILLVGLAIGFLRVGPSPEVTLTPSMGAIGKRTTFVVEVAEPSRGLSRVTIDFVQGDRVENLLDRQYVPRPSWRFWGEATERDTYRIDVGRETIQGLKNAPASVRVTAHRAGTWIRSPDPRIEVVTLPVRLSPPSLQVLSTQSYAAQGGCEFVVYRVGDSSIGDGVRAGEWWFPGFQLPGGGTRDRFAIFAVPYDQDDSGIRLVAVDDAGNEAERRIIDKFFPKPFKTDTIVVTDGFMSKVVPEILSQTPDIADRGSLLENYLAINGELRRINAQAIRELAAKSRAEFLWKRPFLTMPNAKVMSAFADRRTYLYEGREVDRQDHLGFDLAVTRQAPVPAANSGVVILASYFGIFGNTVVLDHGYGLMSLYGHLSSIDVGEGENVERGQILGRTGETGLAGGDHLHFTMLLQGLAVNPVEWWDGHWIRDRMARKLAAAFPFEGAQASGR